MGKGSDYGMIYYATKETMQRYKLKTPGELTSEIAPFAQIIVQREKGNRLYEWGCKLFYFDRRKCLQVMHFETKFVIFLVDLKMKDIEFAANAVAQYIMDMYSVDKKMQKALERYFASSPYACFDKITDRSIIASMNSIQTWWAMDGYRFYDYVKDGILCTKQINWDVNQFPTTRKVDNKDEWIIPYELFSETNKKQFG